MTKIIATMNYLSPEMQARPRYYANDNSKDRLELVAVEVPITNARALPQKPSLQKEGFTLVHHKSCVANFQDTNDTQAIYPDEIKQLIQRITGADEVVVTSPAILRFGEKSKHSGKFNNSRPARFLHVDIDDETANKFAARSANPTKAVRRFIHFNVWRVISPAPQDVPLALCDAQSVSPTDLTPADAIFDEPGKPEWSFTGLILKPNKRHRWLWFKDMRSDEAIVFKTNDSDSNEPHCVPHGAFDNPECPSTATPRISIEIRATAFWYND